MEETRNNRFKRLAEYRTNKIIKKINILGNCSNRSSYDYSESEINKIFNAIDKCLKETKQKFSYKKRDDKKIFKL